PSAGNAAPLGYTLRSRRLSVPDGAAATRRIKTAQAAAQGRREPDPGPGRLAPASAKCRLTILVHHGLDSFMYSACATVSWLDTPRPTHRQRQSATLCARHAAQRARGT